MPDSIETVIAARLKQARTAAGLSQGEVAARMTALGVPTKVPAVSMVESGRRRVTLTELATFIRAVEGDNGGAQAEVRRFLFHPTSDMDATVAAQMEALSGVQWLTGWMGQAKVAMPPADRQIAPEVLAAAEDIAADRQRERILDGIAHNIPWRELGLGQGPELGPLDDFHRDLILDGLEDLFGSRDILEVRDIFVEDANQADKDNGTRVTAEKFAQYRGWATRRVTDLLIDELAR